MENDKYMTPIEEDIETTREENNPFLEGPVEKKYVKVAEDNNAQFIDPVKQIDPVDNVVPDDPVIIHELGNNPVIDPTTPISVQSKDYQSIIEERYGKVNYGDSNQSNRYDDYTKFKNEKNSQKDDSEIKMYNDPESLKWKEDIESHPLVKNHRNYVNPHEFKKPVISPLAITFIVICILMILLIILAIVKTGEYFL